MGFSSLGAVESSIWVEVSCIESVDFSTLALCTTGTGLLYITGISGCETTWGFVGVMRFESRLIITNFTFPFVSAISHWY